MDRKQHPRRFLGVLGVVYIVVGAFLNVWLLVSPPAHDSLVAGRRAWAVLSVLLVGWGMVTLQEWRRVLVVNLNFFLFVGLVVMPLLGEVLLRSGIALNLASLRESGLYADSFSDDWYWVLNYFWKEGGDSMRTVSNHPVLGWAPLRTKENPLGVVADGPYQPVLQGNTILFFGDSFVGGEATMLKEYYIPQLLGSRLPDATVYNFGVGCYGLDQVYLRFKETHGQFVQPTIIFGILTNDLDRAVLHWRCSPKPYFSVANGALVLHGVPVSTNYAEWQRQQPSHPRSYLLALTSRLSQVFMAGGNPYELALRRNEKEEINTKIIDAVVHEANQRHLPLLFVLFYGEWELSYTGWREQFLKQQLARLGVPYIDTKEVLLQSAAREGQPPSVYYYADPRKFGHLNERGNQQVAEAIAAYYQQRSPRTNQITVNP